jgi:hypothetical protein
MRSRSTQSHQRPKPLNLVIYLRFIPTTRQTKKYPENFYTFLFRATTNKHF